jgi:ferredoxin
LHLALLPLLVTLFTIGGNRLAPTLAATDSRVLRALELMSKNPDPKLLRAEAWRTQRKEPADAVIEARRVQAEFRTGATWLGAWFGLAIGLRGLALARRARREEYEAEPGACVSCARCYAACPVENRARFGHLDNLIGGTA